MKKVGVVLSGSGLSGYVGIALVELFFKHNIRPEFIIGCSSGSWISALWASGATYDEMLDCMFELHKIRSKKRINLRALMAIVNPFAEKKHDLTRSLYDVSLIKYLLDKKFSDLTFSDLQTKLVLQTTDIEKGCGYAVKAGSLSKAVYASSATMPFQPPEHIDDRWLANGVFSCPIPLHLAFGMDYDVLLIVAPQISFKNKPQSFMGLYADFLQNSVKHFNSTANVVNIYLENKEVFMIPMLVTVDEIKKYTTIEEVLLASKTEISVLERQILQMIKYPLCQCN